MSEVFALYHQHVQEGSGYLDRKLIAYYSTDAEARNAIERLKGKSGFRDHPEGWQIVPLTVDQDDWTEGFDPKTHEKVVKSS